MRDDNIWKNVKEEIPNFNFYSCGIKTNIENMSPIDVFRSIFNAVTMNLLIINTNRYRSELLGINRRKIVGFERKILGLCRLQGIVKIPVIRNDLQSVIPSSYFV